MGWPFATQVLNADASSPAAALTFRPLFFAVAFFFAAHRFFIAIDSAFRPASVRPPFLTRTGALDGAALRVATTEAAAAAFAALIAP
jgi:hypothetical protein